MKGKKSSHGCPYFVCRFVCCPYLSNTPDMIFIGLSANGQLRTVSIGISPSPGTPPTALSLRKYHCNRYLSSLFSEADREFSQRAQLLWKGAVPWECRLSLSPDNNGNVSVAGIFNFCQGSREEYFFLSPYIPHYFFVCTIPFLNEMYPHPLLLTFLRFECHVFYGFTICLLKTPSILYWAIFFDLNEDFFDN